MAVGALRGNHIRNKAVFLRCSLRQSTATCDARRCRNRDRIIFKIFKEGVIKPPGLDFFFFVDKLSVEDAINTMKKSLGRTAPEEYEKILVPSEAEFEELIK